ncbi:hypothetical protein SDC9_121746 [bioreactor metagenome]|uniref:Uncharacterized protein n=1 Tax=bioreactor metagenome TaxID=1076179 RepID=A0A645CCT4_9ZZZZ
MVQCMCCYQYLFFIRERRVDNHKGFTLKMGETSTNRFVFQWIVQHTAILLEDVKDLILQDGVLLIVGSQLAFCLHF